MDRRRRYIYRSEMDRGRDGQRDSDGVIRRGGDMFNDTQCYLHFFIPELRILQYI